MEQKIYNEFKKIVAKAGRIKLAWFTTFNFHPSFFEKYILTSLVQMDPGELRGVKDFEALNAKLFLEDHIDVRVFYDYRALRLRESKKTSVRAFGVDPAKFAPRFRGGVFHPKVCLLVNEENGGWLITGSANLSLGGWGRNCECLAIRKIEDRQNAQRISDFFSQLVAGEEEGSPLSEINAAWQRKLVADADWEFLHSLQEKVTLLDRFTGSNGSIYVWSPYFSEDIPDLIGGHFSAFSKVHIIPDVSIDNAIRLTASSLEKLKNSEKISICEDPRDFQGQNPPLVHAKVWITESEVALGSWNFTKAGLNIGHSGINVEAGIVQPISPSEFKKLIASAGLIPHPNINGMTKENLDADRQASLNTWRMSCSIMADWESYQYFLLYEGQLEAGRYYVQLPGKAQRVDLFELQKKGVSFFSEHKTVLKDRLFSVYEHQEAGEAVFVGMIIELNAKERPAVGFSSLDEFLRAWTDGCPKSKIQRQSLNYSDDQETGEEIDRLIAEELKGNYSNAWFTMFLSFEHMMLRLKALEHDGRELKILGYQMPGSIAQLRDHLQKHRALFESKNGEEAGEGVSEVFLWFLLQEGNKVINTFNRMAEGKNLGPRIEKVDLIPVNWEMGNNRKMKKWLKFIQDKCQYDYE